MNLYLVRHGRTGDNEAGIAAPFDSALSEVGVTQAISVAQRLEDVKFEKIISSDATRARDTASHIAKKQPVDIVTTPLLREYRRPSEMVGLAYESDEAQRIYRLIEEHMEDPAWHYSDEENYYEMRGRLLQFLGKTEKEKYETILAVTHSLVIRLMTCLVVFGQDLSASQFHDARWNMKIVNTGITILQFTDGTWQLLTFNDIAHLAE